MHIYGKVRSRSMSKERKKLYFIIGGAAAAVLIVALLLVLLLGGGKGKKYEKYYSAAEAAFLVRDYDKAMKNLDKAMAIDATEECYLLRADVYYAQGDVEQAIQVLYLG